MPEPLNGKDLLAEEIFAINTNAVYLVYAKKQVPPPTFPKVQEWLYQKIPS